MAPERLLWILSQQWTSAIEIHIVMECVGMVMHTDLDVDEAAQLEALGMVEALAGFIGRRRSPWRAGTILFN
jgi:hypothetical protein